MKFNRGWWGIGLGDYLPCKFTYQLYDLASLPAVDVPGGYDWLVGADPVGKRMYRAEGDVPAGLAFDEFFARPELPLAFASPTDCFWRVRDRGEFESGRLVEFMADSQGCVYWYLFVGADGAQPVLAGDAGDGELVQAADSFGEFLRRLWIETTGWYEIVGEKRPPEAWSPLVREYVRQLETRVGS
ncbi:hypothetical protein [Dactylosporangium sp. CS-033363]|uniref:hypothetical protein n=1 Tax=Dactylosporangium sp. CS-033363 TaxID=3239935 RepID=UPI003D94B18C